MQFRTRMQPLILLAAAMLPAFGRAQQLSNSSAQLRSLESALSPGALLLQSAQEIQDFDDFAELPLANYLRRGVDPYFSPSVPALYLAVATQQDVVAGVQYAIDSSMKVAFRGGGHHQAGVAFLPGGITIDMGALKDIQINESTGACRFEAGLQGLELADVTSQYGLHYRIGHATSNGVAGFTLGGGAGWGGLALDLITGFDVVSTWLYPQQPLSIIKVDADSYPDLFSALQGAGQMTGAVVAFYANLQQLPPDNVIRVVETIWPLAEAPTFWSTWIDFNATHTPDEALELSSAYVTIPGIGPVVTLDIWDWSPENVTGTSDYIASWIETATAAGALVMDQPTPYLDTIGAFNATQQYPNATHYSRTVIVSELNEEIQAILDAGFANATTPLSIFIIDDLDTSGKPNNATAWGWKGNVIIYLWAFWTRTEGGALVDGDAQHVAWVEDLRAQLDPYFLGQYINFQDFNAEADTQQCFAPANWPGVVAAKAKYDPQNLFRELTFYHSGPGGTGPQDAAATSGAGAGANS